MLSAFNTKLKALQSKVPQSSLDSPWRMALFWMVATVVILASFLLMIIWELFKAMARPDENSSPVDNHPRNDEGHDANGYLPGSPYYSKPGSINPMLIELWDSDNKKNHF